MKKRQKRAKSTTHGKYISKRIIRHVEHTEGREFKKVPTVKGTTRYGGTNTLDATVEGKKVVKVHSASVSLSKHLKTPKGRDWGKVVLIHELRENLNNQHRLASERHRHKQAQKHEKNDKRWLKRNGFFSKGRVTFGPDIKTGKR